MMRTFLAWSLVTCVSMLGCKSDDPGPVAPGGSGVSTGGGDAGKDSGPALDSGGAIDEEDGGASGLGGFRTTPRCTSKLRAFQEACNLVCNNCGKSEAQRNVCATLRDKVAAGEETCRTALDTVSGWKTLCIAADHDADRHYATCDISDAGADAQPVPEP